jgi:hypothetical protein
MIVIYWKQKDTHITACRHRKNIFVGSQECKECPNFLNDEPINGLPSAQGRVHCKIETKVKKRCSICLCEMDKEPYYKSFELENTLELTKNWEMYVLKVVRRKNNALPVCHKCLELEEKLVLTLLTQP